MHRRASLRESHTGRFGSFGWRAAIHGQPRTLAELASYFRDEPIDAYNGMTPFSRGLEEYEKMAIVDLLATSNERTRCAVCYVSAVILLLEARDSLQKLLREVDTNGGSQILRGALTIARDTLLDAEFTNHSFHPLIQHGTLVEMLIGRRMGYDVSEAEEKIAMLVVTEARIQLV